MISLALYEITIENRENYEKGVSALVENSNRSICTKMAGKSAFIGEIDMDRLTPAHFLTGCSSVPPFPHFVHARIASFLPSLIIDFGGASSRKIASRSGCTTPAKTWIGAELPIEIEIEPAKV